MFLDKGIFVESITDYYGYMSIRWDLVRLENRPDEWGSGKLGIPPTDDWASYKSAYIDRKIREYKQHKIARQADPNVSGVIFTGPDHKIVHPLPHNGVYVKRSSGGGVFNGTPLSKEQQFDILYKGKHPQGKKIIYINQVGNILNEKPPPISREDLGFPKDVLWPPKNQEHLDSIYEEVRRRYRQHPPKTDR